MKEDTNAGRSQQKPRSGGIRQSDIARAVRGAMQGGMEVREVIATRDAIRILAGPGVALATSDNSWDDVLNG